MKKKKLSDRDLDLIRLRTRALFLFDRVKELRDYFEDEETLYSCREFVDETRAEIGCILNAIDNVLKRLDNM